jgi:lipoprotein NlpD
MPVLDRVCVRALCVFAAIAVGGCGSVSLNRPPVEDRGSPATKTPAVTDAHSQPLKPPPGIENAGKAGYYTVKPGDTLIKVGLDSGQSYKDIGRWNGLDNPNKIEVGQVLRVIPPGAGDSVAVASPVAAPGAVSSSAIGAAAPARPASAPSAASAATVPPGAGSAVAAVALPKSAPALTAEDDLGWIWPGGGQVLAGFDESKNKGLDIGGSAGDLVLAAADGKVVYAGSGLRGYGNLIILKHNNTYLTAYAHNQALYVKEDQTVKKGQKIADMGSTDAERVKLHFEIRRQGKPVDPLKYLPVK